MKTSVFGDIHGNAFVLKELFKREQGCDYICLGDFVGYGPQNNECINLLRENNVKCILGNHEEMFISGSASRKCSELAKKFFNYSYANFDNKNNFFLKGLFKKISKYNIIFKHTIYDKYIYENSDISDISCRGSYCIGHSHQQFEILKKGLRIVNPGSLGQNRKNKNIAQYAVYDEAKDSFEFKEFKYNIEDFIDLMKKKGYTQDLIDYYKYN